MALVKAVAAGAVAAMAVPYLLRNDTTELGQFIRSGTVSFMASDYQLYWSWPLFSIVTLFTWGMLAWANK